MFFFWILKPFSSKQNLLREVFFLCLETMISETENAGILCDQRIWEGQADAEALRGNDLGPRSPAACRLHGNLLDHRPRKGQTVRRRDESEAHLKQSCFPFKSLKIITVIVPQYQRGKDFKEGFSIT